MKLTILGCHSATPRPNAHTTAQLLELRGHLFLIDCGEATQVAIRRKSAKFARIKRVFISHLHGDHFFGLAGLISTFQLLGREAELHIYAPKGSQEVISLLLKVSGSYLSFPLIFHELSSKISEIIFEDEKVEVRTIPLDHRIYTNGFLFKEKNNERKLNIDAVNSYNIETCYFQKIKNGDDILLENGDIIANRLLTFDPPPPKSYAFCSDTAYCPSIIPLIKGVQVLYHEATFLETHSDLAEKTKHSTALQAAKIASQAEVSKLILGHYSTRYTDFQSFKTEAETLFRPTILAEDGKVFIF